MSHYRAVIIGNESLAIQCAEMLREAGHQISAVVTRNADVKSWAEDLALPVYSSDEDLASALKPIDFDWLFSIANLDIIAPSVLALPKRGAVNFHDGPLPRYAGLNAPVWALLAGETEYGISWHMIADGIDNGGLLAQQFFDVSADETVLSLNTKCYAAAIESFATVIEKTDSNRPDLDAQDFSQRSYFAKNARPSAAGCLAFSTSAASIATLVRALDHGGYWNPLTCPKVENADQVWLVGLAKESDVVSDAPAGTVIAVAKEGITVATATAPITLGALRDAFGQTVEAIQVAKIGDVLESPDADVAAKLDAVLQSTVKHEERWRKALLAMSPTALPLIDASAPSGEILTLPLHGEHAQLQAAFAFLGASLGDVDEIDLALHVSDSHIGYLCEWVPIRAGADLTASIADARAAGPFAADLCARIPKFSVTVPTLGLSQSTHIAGTALTLTDDSVLHADTGKIPAEVAGLMAERITFVAAQFAKGSVTPSVVSPAEREKMLVEWNDTAQDFDADLCIHEAFEAQVGRTPDAAALAFEGETLTYAALNTRANEMAHILRGMGVGPDVIVGLHLKRSSELLIAALAILKAGGAYLPIDPAYPADRTALYIADSGTKLLVTDTELAAGLPKNDLAILRVDALPEVSDNANPESGVSGRNLAYMIYTSGSTGRPKGVMVEHRNVSNFFIGMDGRIAHEAAGVWMAVTSLSFDISVLELFWTLARGFKVVMSSDDNRALIAGDASQASGAQDMEFSLFYWGNDDGIGRGKYRSLIEGAKFADENGFCAVWTPERHFHAFGGPYPNPSVTGAAVAAVTKNIGVRAGSCVIPLHHTARVAEEWAVIDNLTDGKAGLAIASGWQPDDFILRPENTPPANKPAMFEAIADLRKLWSGEAVAFPRQDGEMHSVVTQPRPVSKTLNVWVTTAGNPETWKEAGKFGCNVLTHLLGQSVPEVGEKIKIYHEALREAGHDPADFTVTLMLHSFLAETRDKAREIAREPMKDYLRAAAGLIKQYAWAFPAFKKPKGVENPMQIDLGSLDEDEMEGILDFAFERYFNDSGLFGTIEDANARVAEVKAIGVTEIACLIDYGINVDAVLESLRPLAKVVANFKTAPSVADDDYSIAAQIQRHRVTHMQCTPSMAQMLVMNDESRAALKNLDYLMVGGEALPGALSDELRDLTGGHVENMYGPTETTIWSTTQSALGGQGVIGIGSPIANTQVYVLDEAQNPAPIGVAGELFIAGAGVTRGYFQRDDLTEERFLPNPFMDVDTDAAGGGRMYRTGDLVRWAADGKLEFLGRTDFQVKLRGYRIELGEIESAINTTAKVQQSVVVAREDTPGLVQLVGYLLSRSPIDEAKLRTELAQSLPDYMVPRHFVALTSFPLTPNKKIDRNALPAPLIGKQAPEVKLPPKEPEALPTAGGESVENFEVQIAAIWSRLLGVAQISPRDSFFDLGGHSLLAVQVHREIRNELGVAKLSITDIFRAPTLGALAAIVAQKSVGGSPKPAAPVAEAVKPAPVVASGGTREDAMARRREMRARRNAK